MSTPYDPMNGPQRVDGQPAQWPAPGWGQGPPPPPKRQMPWYGWGCLGLIAAFTFLVVLGNV